MGHDFGYFGGAGRVQRAKHKGIGSWRLCLELLLGLHAIIFRVLGSSGLALQEVVQTPVDK